MTTSGKYLWTISANPVSIADWSGHRWYEVVCCEVVVPDLGDRTPYQVVARLTLGPHVSFAEGRLLEDLTLSIRI